MISPVGSKRASMALPSGPLESCRMGVRRTLLPGSAGAAPRLLTEVLLAAELIREDRTAAQRGASTRTLGVRRSPAQRLCALQIGPFRCRGWRLGISRG